MLYGVDTDTPLSAESCKVIRGISPNVVGVGRYLRNMNAAEVAIIHAAGLKIWPIAERGEPTFARYFTPQQADSDRQWAQELSKSLQIPIEVPIWFTLDGSFQYIDLIQRYVERLLRMPHKVGIYCNAQQGWHLFNSGIGNDISYWQTSGNGSNGLLFPWAKMVQYVSGQSNMIAGVPVDWNVVDESLLW